MNNNEFNSFIKIKIQALVDRIMQQNGRSLVDALDFLYNSRTYDNLITENKKLWHFSTEKLYQILTDEYQNNKISFNDYAWAFKNAKSNTKLSIVLSRKLS